MRILMSSSVLPTPTSKLKLWIWEISRMETSVKRPAKSLKTLKRGLLTLGVQEVLEWKTVINPLKKVNKIQERRNQMMIAERRS